MKELKLEELTTRQKLGMTMTALMTGTDEENVEYVLGLIRDHALGDRKSTRLNSSHEH